MACKASSDEASGLEASITLATGARVMLISNIWIETGLVNGSLGTIKEIVYKSGGPPDLPIAVTVLFDNDLHCMITPYPLVLYKEIGYIMANVAQDYSFHCG